MIEKMMEYKSNLRDWAYFRTMKLTYQYLAARYEDMLPKFDKSSGIGEDLPCKDFIWCCWLQGLDNAPVLVKKCVDSLKKFDRKIMVITSDNYSEYVDIPDYIIKKKEQGIITNAHFSDILRAELLSKLGGTWIDATVFCSDKSMLDEVLNDNPLFCYSFAMRDSVNAYMLYDSWVLHSSKKSMIIEDVKGLLHLYWQNEDQLLHYFLFHLMFSIACNRHPEEKEKIPLFTLEPCHILQLEMQKPFEKKRWDQIMRMSGIHKLTYKYDPSVDIGGTMLEYLINKG
ncbi:MAG: capsular polysaccharide synthesis protein [Lachnospiraceae bacterium]|nr:capsular polysaccharide synthesis protein [Lachnospiraceae bacterium]